MLTSKALQGACRALTQALCTRIYVEDGVVTDDVLADPFEELLYLRRRDMARHRTSGRPRNAYGAPKGAIGRGTPEPACSYGPYWAVVRIRPLWWRCRESNPGPTVTIKGFFGRSHDGVFSAFPLRVAQRETRPSLC